MKLQPTAFVIRQWQQLTALPGAGDAVARGFALGIGLGFTPLFGVKTLLALLVVPLLRGNRMAAVVGTTLHDILLPVMPALLRLEYDLGFWILHRPHRWPATLQLHHLHPHDWMSWTTFIAVAPPLLIGSLVVATPVSFLVYLITARAVRYNIPGRQTPGSMISK